MSNPKPSADVIEPDTLYIEGEGAPENLLSVLRTHSMGIPASHNPRIEAHRIVIDMGETALEITASDGLVDIREVDDE